MRVGLDGLLVLALLGCSAAHVESGERVALEEFVPRLAATLCEARHECCSAVPVDEEHPTESGCVDWVAQQIRGLVTGETQWSGPRPWPEMAFDQQAAARLIATFEDAAQDCMPPPSPEAIQALFRPNKSIGDDCNSNKECPNGICRPKSVTANADRTCAPLGETGDACIEHFHCAASLVCNPDPDGQDLPRTCSLGGELGDPCYNISLCRKELVCGGLGRCVEPTALGEPCEPYPLLCGLPNRCAEDSNFRNVCVAPLPIGELCIGAWECVSGVAAQDETGQSRCVACSADNCGSVDDGYACVDGVCSAERTAPTWPTYTMYSYSAERECVWSGRPSFSPDYYACFDLPKAGDYCELGHIVMAP